MKSAQEMTSDDERMKEGDRLDQLCINTIRMLAVDAVEKARSGHPGMPMEAADIAFVLWTRFLKHHPGNPQWPNRDRFVLSAGHGSMLLYALLHLTGYEVSLEDIRQFRQWHSKTPGHPEYGQLNPDERIDIETAIQVFTRNGAIAMEREDETGTIEPGKSADFIVINQNILEVPVTKIHKTKVLRTYLKGHTVYEGK